MEEKLIVTNIEVWEQVENDYAIDGKPIPKIKFLTPDAAKLMLPSLQEKVWVTVEKGIFITRCAKCGASITERNCSCPLGKLRALLIEVAASK